MRDWRQEIRRQLAGLRLAPVREDEIVEELAQHLDDLYQELLAGGATPEQAYDKVRAELAASQWLAKELRRVERLRPQEPIVLGSNQRGNMITDFGQDVRYGLRSLGQRPGFTATAVLILALGIGAGTAIFSLIDAVLMKSLPVKDPAQLVVLTTASNAGAGPAGFSYPLFQDLRERNQVFTGIFAYSSAALHLSGNEQTERVAGGLVSGNFFSELGVKPHLGRFFSDERDQAPGALAEAILSYDFWAQRFNRDPTLIGKTVDLNGYPFTLVGVAPAGFFGVEVGQAPAVWIPISMQAQVAAGDDRLRLRNNFWVRVMGRLKPGVTEQQAETLTDALFRQINEEAPGMSPGLQRFLSGQHVQLQSASRGLSTLRRQFKQPLVILMGIVGLVLLITCANVANLLLVRAAARQKEIAVRLALGASRFRLIRQLLTESLLLSALGALLGLLFAFGSSRFLLAYLSRTGYSLDLRPDFRVLGFNLGIALLTGLLFGLVPALQTTRVNLLSALKSERSTMAVGRRRFELRQLLVVSQVAISVLLLVGAGLFIRTLQNLKEINLGFNADQVLLVSLNPGFSGYTPDQVDQFYEQLLERVRAMPAVESASFADMPLMGGAWVDGILIEGYQAGPGEDMSTSAKRIAPQFFQTMGIGLMRGRDFNAADGADSPKVAIINETVARDFFGDTNPLGRRIGVGTDKPDREIIGVIKDTKYRFLKDPIPRTVYVPLAQTPSRSAELTLQVKTIGEPKSVVPAIRREVQTLDKNLPLYNVKTFNELVAESMSQERLLATLSSFFGLLALSLAVIGLYGLMTYTVVRRTTEIGIRLALGAQVSDILKLVMWEGLALTLIGILVGVPAALALTRVATGLLFGISATDPITFVLVPGLLAAVALLACYAPARRASRVDPMETLRYE